MTVFVESRLIAKYHAILYGRFVENYTSTDACWTLVHVEVGAHAVARAVPARAPLVQGRSAAPRISNDDVYHSPVVQALLPEGSSSQGVQ